MSCIKLPLPSLPAIPLLKFSFTFPSFGLNADFCCHFSILQTPPVRIPGVPMLTAVIQAINVEIALLEAYLAAKDLALSCPLDKSPPAQI